MNLGHVHNVGMSGSILKMNGLTQNPANYVRSKAMTRKIYTGDYDIGEPSLSPPRELDHDQDEYEQALHDHLCDCEEFDGS